MAYVHSPSPGRIQLSEDYDIDALKRGLESINTNISNIKMALVSEEKKKAQYERLIMEAEVKSRS